MTDEVVLNMDKGEPPFVQKSTDPVLWPVPYASPADFAAQYPTPLDPLEVLAKCEEISVWQAIPEQRTGLQAYTWREMDALAFNSGSNYIAFADGTCPEAYAHAGDNYTVTLKNLGVQKNLSISDIMHSQAVAGVGGGIGSLLGPFPSSEGMPGGTDLGTFQREVVRNVKEKEVVLGMTLLMNGWDRLLVTGDATNRTLEFNGIENWETGTSSCAFHKNQSAWATSGTFSAATFDRFLSESCAKPTHIFGHPQGIQELLSAYFQLGYQGSQVVNFADGNRITPGYNFASFVNTAIGRLQVVADSNFTQTAAGASLIQTRLWPLRMTHNGEPLVYKITQIPLAYKDLTPGCTAISFQIWTKTALIIKICCAQGVYTTLISGNISSTCGIIG